MTSVGSPGQGPDAQYADTVHVSVRLAYGGPLDKYVHTVWEIQTASGSFVRDQIGADVRTIPAAPRAEGDAPHEYALEVREKEFEWGASSAALELVMYLAAGGGAGIVGNAAYDATKALARKLGQSLKAQHPDWTAFPLEELEAIGRTKLLVSQRFDEPYEALTLVESKFRPPDQASATVRGSNGTYACELTVVDGLVTFTEIRRAPSWPDARDH